MQAIICDIDGTIAKHGPEGRGFTEYGKVGEDVPVPTIIGLVRRYSRDHVIILLSGRENRDYCRSLTELWLKVHDVPYDHLFMRKCGDFRRDNIIKEEIYKQQIVPMGFSIQFVLDDRDRVVKMWRELGLVCLQVAEGNF